LSKTGLILANTSPLPAIAPPEAHKAAQKQINCAAFSIF
jgi:hypothetical protein